MAGFRNRLVGQIAAATIHSFALWYLSEIKEARHYTLTFVNYRFFVLLGSNSNAGYHNKLPCYMGGINPG